MGFIPHPFTLGALENRYESLDDERFNRFQSVKLGFINYFERGSGLNVSFAERLPVRRQKQGLCDENFNCSTLGGGIRQPFAAVYTSPAFDEMCRGVYPTWDDALEALVPGSSVGVDRHFAVRRSESGGTALFNNREEVGIIFRGQLYLNAERQYLTETIIDNPNLPNSVEIL